MIRYIRYVKGATSLKGNTGTSPSSGHANAPRMLVIREESAVHMTFSRGSRTSGHYARGLDEALLQIANKSRNTWARSKCCKCDCKPWHLVRTVEYLCTFRFVVAIIRAGSNALSRSISLMTRRDSIERFIKDLISTNNLISPL